DVALRVRSRPSGEDQLVLRVFRQLDEFLVASPAYLARAGNPTVPAQLGEHATLERAADLERRAWELIGPGGGRGRAGHSPRMARLDFIALRAAVLAGLGIALLPESAVRADLASGALTRVLPNWNAPQGILHAVFPSRRGMRPAVRAFIDFLAANLPATL